MESSYFALADVEAAHAAQNNRYLQFLTVPELSLGLYNLPAGAEDLQTPHLEDEIYVVLEGSARLRVDGQEQDVGAGTVLFVGATTDHSFFDIREDLTLLAIFGPAGGAGGFA